MNPRGAFDELYNVLFRKGLQNRPLDELPEFKYPNPLDKYSLVSFGTFAQAKFQFYRILNRLGTDDLPFDNRNSHDTWNGTRRIVYDAVESFGKAVKSEIYYCWFATTFIVDIANRGTPAVVPVYKPIRFDVSPPLQSRSRKQETFKTSTGRNFAINLDCFGIHDEAHSPEDSFVYCQSTAPIILANGGTTPIRHLGLHQQVMQFGDSDNIEAIRAGDFAKKAVREAIQPLEVTDKGCQFHRLYEIRIGAILPTLKYHNGTHRESFLDGYVEEMFIDISRVTGLAYRIGVNRFTSLQDMLKVYPVLSNTIAAYGHLP